MRTLFSILLFTILLIFAAESCDAPRNNPLDPGNPDNTIHTITGIVQTASVPFQPIEGVVVSVKEGNYITQTNASGYFQIELYGNNNITLLFEGAGYHTDSVSIEWNNLKKINLNINLNAHPKLDEVQFYSSVLYRHPDNKSTSLTVKTIISDKEYDDIETVLIDNPFYNLSHRLEYNLGQACYELTFTSADLYINDIEGVIGKEFNIIVQNSEEDSFIVGTTSIKRIINQQPEFISPANNIDTITVGPTLKWKRFEAGYYFNYKVEVYTNEIWPVLMWQKENVSSTEIEIFVDVNLPAGDYFWVFWCIDEFNNRVRSKPASFQIQ